MTISSSRAVHGKADEQIAVGTWVLLSMAMVGWVGAGMEVVVGRHAGQSQGTWSHVGRCWSTSRVRGLDTDDNRSHRLPGMQLLVGLSQNCSIFWGRP